MNILVTAGPTREHIDRVRFITNASSGRMGYAVAAAAREAGHEVTLLTGPVALDAPEGVTVQRFTTVAELKHVMDACFSDCDVLVMTAAVGDFTVAEKADSKLSRRGGPVQITLVPTEDVLANVAAGKGEGQFIVAFAVEDGPREQIETKARDELARKGGDIVVLNTPAAMDVDASEATILSASETLLPWARREKTDLAAEIIRLIDASTGT
ncbi:MAG: hypothetical protein KGY81_06950 [Phycisphaerae bacterium]|nr:hypothetical protein [Phycisphaerae bacterium]